MLSRCRRGKLKKHVHVYQDQQERHSNMDMIVVILINKVNALTVTTVESNDIALTIHSLLIKIMDLADCDIWWIQQG